MSKAEERAFERYPDYREVGGEYVPQIHKRKVFAEGYLQAEKDLTDQVKKTVDIAREEVIEQTVEWLTKHAKKYYFNKERYLGTDELVEDYKLVMSMNDEKCTQET